jgi:hypothetical protein
VKKEGTNKLKKTVAVRTYILLLLISLLVVLGLIFYAGSQDKTRLLQKELQKVYHLPTTYTIEQAVKDGMVNVTDISDKPNEKITVFLTNAEKKNWSILKTISSNEEDLIITVYIYDDRIDEIRTWRYFVKDQANQSPDRRFKSAYKITNEAGVTTVYLVNIPNTQRPNNQSEILKDEVLYSYH